MNIQPEPITDPETPPTTEAQTAPPSETETAPVSMQSENAQPAQEIMEETSKPDGETDTTYFFPNLLDDGRSVSASAPDRETAESRAKEQLAQETAQSS